MIFHYTSGYWPECFVFQFHLHCAVSLSFPWIPHVCWSLKRNITEAVKTSLSSFSSTKRYFSFSRSIIQPQCDMHCVEIMPENIFLQFWIRSASVLTNVDTCNTICAEMLIQDLHFFIRFVFLLSFFKFMQAAYKWCILLHNNSLNYVWWRSLLGAK